MMKLKRLVADDVCTVGDMVEALKEINPDLPISDGCTSGYRIELFEHENSNEQEIVMEAI